MVVLAIYNAKPQIFTPRTQRLPFEAAASAALNSLTRIQ